jgi:hypothetical protein
MDNFSYVFIKDFVYLYSGNVNGFIFDNGDNGLKLWIVEFSFNIIFTIMSKNRNTIYQYNIF